jgi:WD40 repeat protein
LLALLTAPGIPCEARAEGPPDRPGGEAARTDLYGDPLPPGVVARLGTIRFRGAESLHSLAFTPDGKFLVAGSDRGADVLEAATGRPLRRLGEELPDSFGPAALSPDGKLAAVGSRGANGGAVYEVATGRRVCRLGRPQADLRPICFSPDGKFLAAHGGDADVSLFDPATGVILRTLKRGQAAITAAVLTPGGKGLLAAESDGTIRLWDPRTGSPVRRLARSPDGVFALALSADGSRLATAGLRQRSFGINLLLHSPNNRLRLWDMATGRQVREMTLPASTTPGEPPAGPNTLAFGADGERVWTGGEDGVVRVWDWATGKEVRRWADHSGPVSSLAFTPDGVTFAVVEDERVIRVRDRTTGRDPAPPAGHRGAGSAAAISPDGRTVATGGDDCTVCLWDLRTGRQMRRLAGHKGFIRGVSFAADGKTLLSYGLDLTRRVTLHVWDLDTGRERRRVALDDASGPVSPNGQTLALVNYDAIRLQDVATGRTIRTLTGLTDVVSHVTFSPDGRTLLAVTNDGELHRWDVGTGDHRRHRCPGLKDGTPFAVAISPDLRLAAFAFDDHIALVDAVTGVALRRFTYPLPGSPDAGVWHLVFSPDGRTLAWSGEDRAIYLGESASGRVRRRLAGHRGEVQALAFTADGRFPVSGSKDTTGLVWDLMSAPGVERRPLARGDLARCWDDLAQADAPRADVAQRRLLTEPAASVADLARRLRPVAPVDARRLAERIADLDSECFEVREEATAELRRWGELAEGPLRRVLAGRPSLEVRLRVQALLGEVDVACSPERLRQVRALEVLEAAGTAEARRLLEELAAGAPAAIQTREAKAALARLAQRAAAGP